MKNNGIIANMELLNRYEYYAWEILSELRAAEGLNYEKVKEVFEILEQMIEIYRNENQIEKLVAETFVLIPENILAISKIDIIQGKEIRAVGNRFSDYRNIILKHKTILKPTIVDKQIIDEFRKNSIGEKGFFPLIKKNNKLDMDKVKKTFEALDDMIRIYEDYYVIDKEVLEIIVAMKRCLYLDGLQDNVQISQNVSGQFAIYIDKLIKIKE